LLRIATAQAYRTRPITMNKLLLAAAFRSPKTGGRKLEGKVWSQFPKRAAAPEQLAVQAGA